MILVLQCEPSFTPGCGLKYIFGVYLEFKIINDSTYPKNVIHIHTSDINKLDRVKNKSDHSCEIGKLSSEPNSSFRNAVERLWKWSGILTLILNG